MGGEWTLASVSSSHARRAIIAGTDLMAAQVDRWTPSRERDDWRPLRAGGRD
jgi:hypothetical protein